MRLRSLFPTEETLGINTDLYELTMAAAYFRAGRTRDWVTFELFTRKLPKSRSFLIAAGLEQALHYMTNVRFTDETLRYLRSLEIFQHVDDAFFDYLKAFRFSGDLYALPEGTICFANEPIIQVSAPAIEAQILETFLINTVNFQSMVASKAARICLAGKDKQIVDFGSRRAHSPQAGVLAARASFIGGCHGTSNVLAGFEMGIPVYGTMAHSYVQFFGDDSEAFRRFHEVFPENTILLVDTYDTLEGVRKAISMEGTIKGVRLDSGDLVALAVKTRDLLDAHGRNDVRIVASGNLDEEKILAFSLSGAPIDAYGVGTDLVVSVDAPSCDLVYKLVEVIGDGKVQPRIKASEGKATVPFRKQVFRQLREGKFAGDAIGRWDESMTGEPLLQKYIETGQLIAELPGDLREIRDRAQEQLSQLPTPFKLLHSAEEYPVEYSKRLLDIQRELEEQYA